MIYEVKDLIAKGFYKVAPGLDYQEMKEIDTAERTFDYHMRAVAPNTTLAEFKDKLNFRLTELTGLQRDRSEHWIDFIDNIIDEHGGSAKTTELFPALLKPPRLLGAMDKITIFAFVVFTTGFVLERIYG